VRSGCALVCLYISYIPAGAGNETFEVGRDARNPPHDNRELGATHATLSTGIQRLEIGLSGLVHMGRASTFTQEIADRICEQLADGVPLTVICSADGMPAPRTVRLWQQQDETFAAAIAGAREAGHDAIADDILTIVDDKSDDPASRRVRADMRLKLLAKWDPKRYGDKQQVEHSGGVTFNATPADEGIL